ncbi:valine--pyruvate transaminase [soil metagenome]
MNFGQTLVGDKMSTLSGVRMINKDTMDALRAEDADKWVNLGGGNPVVLPEVQDMWRRYTRELLEAPDFGDVICRYGASQGYEPLVEAIVNLFNSRYGWGITQRNVLVAPGSQALLFFALNSFGGRDAEGDIKQVILPMSPEYTGYGGTTITEGVLKAYRPSLDILGPHRFKYRPDFERLKIDGATGAVLFSRPSNPTGNVLTDDETQKIVDLAAVYDVPVLIDSAYAVPFPNLVFTEMSPIFGENVIHLISFSKAGLPGERIGVAIGDESYLSVLEPFQANANIHSSRYGQAIAAKAVESGELVRLSETVIRPHYERKLALLEDAFARELPEELPWYLHAGDGAMFAWLWLKDLPMSDVDLYERLKQDRVIVVPGSFFFPGLDEPWDHKQQCIRISLTASEEEIRRGVATIARVVEQAYEHWEIRR